MRIFVVGGAGFIGSHLVDRLLAEHHHVDVIDDLTTGSLGNLAEARSSGGALKIHHLDGSSRVASSLVGIRRPDVIYHLAVMPRRPDSPGELAMGVQRCLNLLEAAREFGVAKVIVALPATAMYGWPAVNSLPVKEAEPVPRGVRGVVARSVLDLLSVYREHDNVEFAALSLASVYGRRQTAGDGVVAAFRHAVETGAPPVFHGDGRQTRDFVYIDDVVDALVRAAERSSGLLINVGTGEETSIKTLWTMVQEARDARLEREAAEAAEDAQTAGDAEAVEGAEPEAVQLRLDEAVEVDPDPLEPEIVAGRRNELTRFAVSSVRARIHLGWSPWTELGDGLARLESGR